MLLLDSYTSYIHGANVQIGLKKNVCLKRHIVSMQINTTLNTILLHKDTEYTLLYNILCRKIITVVYM